MARLPRDVSGARLIALLETLGYRAVRRRGSHVRLERTAPEGHAITVPDHASLRIGTLAAILHEVGIATGTSRDALIEMLEA
jgi:predicted RNA binding protein YcfA (HicA-like mRNA interferase family)